MRFAKILVFDTDRNVLVLRRSSTHSRLAFHPDLPGGIVEDSETFEVGAIRELVEETGIIARGEQLEVLYRSPDSPALQYVIFALNIEYVKPAVIISWEHDQYSWEDISHINGLDRLTQAVVDDINDKTSGKLFTSLN
jgi:8-oxo-dGTP pyrophosphatase MutT (NUDIX family)